MPELDSELVPVLPRTAAADGALTPNPSPPGRGENDVRCYLLRSVWGEGANVHSLPHPELIARSLGWR